MLPPTADPSVARRASGASLVLGYASVMTVGGWEPWAKMVTSDIVVGVWREWGERIVDACSEKWASILARAYRLILSRGFDGVFLDNLDLVDRYEEMTPCVARLVGMLRSLEPRASIMVNRGFSILADIAGSIDHLLVESYPSYYDVSSRSYRVWSNGDLEWIVARVREALALSRRYGFNVYALAYGEPGDARLASEICGVIERFTPGIPVYIAPWLLKKPGRCLECSGASQSPAGRTTVRVTRGAGAGLSPGPLLPPLIGVLLGGAALLLALRLRRKRG